MLLDLAVAASQLMHAAAAPNAPIVRVTTQAKVVALTFDACATHRQPNGFDRAVFEFLRREGIPATVFVTARWVGFHPQEARELAALPTIALGNHSDDHRPLAGLPYARVKTEIARANTAIRGLGREPVAFRPPCGAWDERCVRVARLCHLPTVMWDVAPGDPGPMSAKRLIATVTTRVQPGSIVIFHINGRGRHTAEALPTIVERLREQGYRFVTLPELLALPDARPVVARAVRH